MNGRRMPVYILAVVIIAIATGSLAYALSNARQGYEPRQPILFRHTRMAGPPVWQADATGQQVNVGGFGIPCVYCHTMPYKGRHSTVPSTAVCMNCHTSVGLNREWVLKMKDYWDRGEPIPVGEGARPARLRVLRPRGAPQRQGREGQSQASADRRAGQADGGLRELPRQGRGDGDRLRAARVQHAVVPRLPPEARDEGLHGLRHVPPVRETTMNPNETFAAPDGTSLDRREFLRLSGTLAAAGCARERRLPAAARSDGSVPRHAREPRGRPRPGAVLSHRDRRHARPRADARRAPHPGHAERGRRERAGADRRGTRRR